VPTDPVTLIVLAAWLALACGVAMVRALNRRAERQAGPGCGSGRPSILNYHTEE